MSTLQQLCTYAGITAARCQYLGEPHHYHVDAITPELTNGSANLARSILEGALRMAPFIEENKFRVTLDATENTILVMRHSGETMTECHIAVLYKTAAPISKSLARMIRRQFKNFDHVRPFNAYHALAAPE